MSDPAPRRQPLFSPRALKVLAIAFGAGLLLFLLLWVDQRGNNDFFKPTGPGAAGAEGDALPAPLPSDVASEDGSGNASGLRLPAPADGALPGMETEVPRIIEPPVPPPPMELPQEPAAPAMADVDQPVPTIRPSPRYPSEALRRNIGGKVRVEVRVAADGSVERLELAESSGDRFLDRAALEAVRRWRFQPAIRDGQPVPASVIVPLEFNPGGRR